MELTTKEILVDWMNIQIRSHPGTPVLFISGAQGIGKSTAIEHAEAVFGGRLAVLGLDDFYLTKAQRLALSEAVHPLFSVRGPPGTHDTTFLNDTIDSLLKADASSSIAIPKFDKRIDDRAPPSEWAKFTGQPVAIVIEGWCIGAMPNLNAPASEPLNVIEQSDTSGEWRRFQENQLDGPYSDLWDRADAFCHIRAPSFEQVLDWRIQQEETTLGIARGQLPDEKREWVGRFIKHYERLTKRMLGGERRQGYVLKVDATRQPIVKAATPLIVFSDLDGTLLDHDTYSFEAAKPALQAMAEHACILVMASSKTAAEMIGIRRDAGFEHCPAIVENGAGILEPGSSQGAPDDTVYQDLRSALNELPHDIRGKFDGFGDWTTEEVAKQTGLPFPAAKLAKARCFSEPGQWTGDTAQLEIFHQYLAAKGITSRRGGRFMTLSFGTTKAGQMFKIASRYLPAPTIALGDAPNDVEMILSADYGVVVKNMHGAGFPEQQDEQEKGILRTIKAGPEGWNEAVLGLMQQLGINDAEV